MRATDSVGIAVRGLGRHPLRAGLNVIGVLAGVASTVLVIAVAHGVDRAAASAVQGLGSDLVVVYPSGTASSGIQLGLGSGSSITPDDVRALGDQGFVPDGAQTAPTAELHTTVSSLARNTQTDVLGSSEGFAAARAYTIAEGAFFSSADMASSASVVVLGRSIVDSVFAGADPVGRLVRINTHPFRVVGVLGARGFSGSYNQDDVAVVPITSMWAYVLPATSPRIQQVFVQATTTAKTDAVKTEISTTLLRRHHLIDPAQADFQVRTQQDLIASAERVGTVMKWMLLAMAGISLLAGTLGIVSMMLASVGERAYEIGIRRAVGARRRHILLQFLVEALLLAGIGGVLGITVGVGAASLLSNIGSDVPAPVITASAIGLAAAVALAAGVVAGLVPAMRAAGLQPSESVRRL